MCDISKATKLKKVTVYKLVTKIKEGKYISPYAYFPLHTGVVKKMPGFHKQTILYNENMIGRVGGFKHLEAAQRLLKKWWPEDRELILKIVLSGSIMQGTGKNICGSDFDKDIVYAGTEIISMKEIK